MLKKLQEETLDKRVDEETEVEVVSCALNSDVWKLKNYLLSEVYEKDKYLLGKVLTIIDAVFSDAIQRKAIKDLIKNAFFGENIGNKDYHAERSFHQILNLFNVWMKLAESEVLEEVRKSRDLDLYFEPVGSGTCSSNPGIENIFIK